MSLWDVRILSNGHYCENRGVYHVFTLKTEHWGGMNLLSQILEMFKQKNKITPSKRADWEQSDWEKMLLSNVTILSFFYERRSGKGRKKQVEESQEWGVIYCSDVTISQFISYVIIPVLSGKYFTGQQERGMWRAEREKDEEGEGSQGGKKESENAEVSRQQMWLRNVS